ncbi:hypothetical protein ACWGJP_15225 [Microbacterium sp. NPDC055903]
MIREDELWRSDQPVFSVRVTRRDPVVILPDTDVGRFDGRLIAVTALAVVAWGAIFFLSLPTALLPSVWFPAAIVERAEMPWRLPALILSVVVMMFAVWQTNGRARAAFRENSIGFRLCIVAAGLGLMLGSVLLLPAMAAAVLALAGLVLAACIGLSIPLRVARVRARARAIERLMTTGERSPGVIQFVDSRSGTELGRPRFRRVEIEYRRAEDPAPRTLLAAMAATPTRVPLPGSAVLVLTGADGAAHVIPDPDHPMSFDPDDDRYREANDGGGS